MSDVIIDKNKEMWYVMLHHNLKLITEDLEKENCRLKTAGEKGIRFFTPMGYKLRVYGNTTRREKRPLMPGYMFIRSTLSHLIEYRKQHNYMYFYMPKSHTNNELRPLTVPDADMDSFIKVVNAYTNDIPFYKPGEIDLQKGDRIKVIGGVFDGVEGILISSQGKTKGKVIVQIPGVIAVSSWEIEPEYIQIIKFADGSKRLYDQFDAFFPKAQKILERYCHEEFITDTEQVFLSTFYRRMELLETDSINTHSKLVCALLICCTILNKEDKKQELLKEADKLLQELNSEREKKRLNDLLDVI